MVHGIVIAKKGSDTHLYTESQMYLKSKYELRNTSLIEPNLCIVHEIVTKSQVWIDVSHCVGETTIYITCYFYSNTTLLNIL